MFWQIKYLLILCQGSGRGVLVALEVADVPDKPLLNKVSVGVAVVGGGSSSVSYR